MQNHGTDRQPARWQDDARTLERVRQDTIDVLTDAFANSRLTMEEYERRAGLASGAPRVRDLDDLTADLPAQRGGEAPRAPGAPRAPRAPYAPRTPYPASYPGNVQTTACIMGDRNLTGNWLTGDRVSSFTVMGSTKLDLRDADLPAGPIRIEVFSVMGETKVIVPYGLPVRMSAFPFMGEARIGRDVEQNVRGAETWVEINGFVVMGSIVVAAAS